MFSVLVFIAGAVAAEAGITHIPNAGLRIPYLPVRSHSVRPVLLRSQIVNPIGFSPALNSYAPGIASSLFSPIVFDSVSSYAGPLTSFPKLHPAPINHVAIGPTSTITHISPPVVHRPVTGPSLRRPVLNSALISEAVLRPATITHLPPSPPTVLSQAPINHATIIHGKANTLEALNPINGNEIVHEVQKAQVIPEKSVSYSLSENDYEYLKRHQIVGQDSPYNPIPGSDTASSEEHQNTHHQHGKESQKSSDSDNVLKRSAAPGEANLGFVEPSFVNSPEPVVIKHIYFHVPHPDFEEPPPAPVNLPPPKKTYNILFIKAPAQEQQNHAYLQLMQSQPPTEDKTLIYVLSKKQDPVQILPPQQTRPSSPEVFFVNYQTKSGDIADIRNKLLEESFIESSPLERKRSAKDSQIDNQPENILDEVQHST